MTGCCQEGVGWMHLVQVGASGGAL